MFSNSTSIYTFLDETFKYNHNEFEEVVSEVGADVVIEEYCKNEINVNWYFFLE